MNGGLKSSMNWNILRRRGLEHWDTRTKVRIGSGRLVLSCIVATCRSAGASGRHVVSDGCDHVAATEFQDPILDPWAPLAGQGDNFSGNFRHDGLQGGGHGGGDRERVGDFDGVDPDALGHAEAELAAEFEDLGDAEEMRGKGGNDF